MQPSISIARSAEAAAKQQAALEAAGPFATSDPATVRWLLCGRGRPVDTTAPASPYTVVLTGDEALVLFQDIEASRVEAEERWTELGYEPVAYPWYEPAPVDPQLAAGAAVERALAPLRRRLGADERSRYRVAGHDCADATVATLCRLRPSTTEGEAAAELAAQARLRGLSPAVVLVAGDDRQRLHRHPLPTGAPLGRHALLAITAEREGLHVSMTRLVSFGPAPVDLWMLVRDAAEVDAAMLRASVPGRRLRSVLAAAADAYAARGHANEWRRHHQGGLTGYRGREVFATPRESAPVPDACAVAWNPSIAGGAKSEDTALVGPSGVEVVTRTPSLAELDVDGLSRPGITEL